jgi:hypothetical protein
VIEPLHVVEKRAIIEALVEMNGDVGRAAAVLGIGQATVYRKIKRYDIDIGALRLRSDTVSSDETPSGEPRKSRYDLTQEGDRRKIDVGSADWDALRDEIQNAEIPLAKAAEIAEAAGVAAEHQAFLTDMAVKGLELLIKGAKKAIG